MISLKKIINVCLQETGAFTRETENYTEINKNTWNAEQTYIGKQFLQIIYPIKDLYPRILTTQTIQ